MKSPTGMLVGQLDATAGISGMDYTAAMRDLIQELLDEERSARGLPPASAWEK